MRRNRAWSTPSRKLKNFIRGQEAASKRLRRKPKYGGFKEVKEGRKAVFQKRSMILNKNC